MDPFLLRRSHKLIFRACRSILYTDFSQGLFREGEGLFWQIFGLDLRFHAARFHLGAQKWHFAKNTTTQKRRSIRFLYALGKKGNNPFQKSFRVSFRSFNFAIEHLEREKSLPRQESLDIELFIYRLARFCKYITRCCICDLKATKIDWHHYSFSRHRTSRKYICAFSVTGRLQNGRADYCFNFSGKSGFCRSAERNKR